MVTWIQKVGWSHDGETQGKAVFCSSELEATAMREELAREVMWGRESYTHISSTNEGMGRPTFIPVEDILKGVPEPHVPMTPAEKPWSAA